MKHKPAGYWLEGVTSPVWFPAMLGFSIIVYFVWWVRAEWFNQLPKK